METITGVNLEKLLVGRVFEGDELIISNSGKRMETIRKEPGSDEIRCFGYDIIATKNSVRYNGGCEVTPGEDDYERYKKKLEEAELWH
ncbi:MAG: hypothetical protein AABX50_01890 [Nanoarchaeota archaeon]